MMVFVIGYLLVGIAVVFVSRWVSRVNPSFQDKLNAMRESARRHVEAELYPDGAPLYWALLRILGESVAFIISMLGWPLVAFGLIQRLKGKHIDDARGTADAQAEDKGELLREVTVEEVERIELVTAGGAPNLPFGWLNPVWLTFKEQLKPGDTLWQYRYVPYEGQPLDAWSHEAEGYAIKRNGVVVAKIFSNAG